MVGFGAAQEQRGELARAALVDEVDARAAAQQVLDRLRLACVRSRARSMTSTADSESSTVTAVRVPVTSTLSRSCRRPAIAQARGWKQTSVPPRRRRRGCCATWIGSPARTPARLGSARKSRETRREAQRRRLRRRCRRDALRIATRSASRPVSGLARWASCGRRSRPRRLPVLAHSGGCVGLDSLTVAGAAPECVARRRSVTGFPFQPLATSVGSPQAAGSVTGGVPGAEGPRVSPHRARRARRTG